MINLTIDEQKVQVEEGTSVLEAAIQAVEEPPAVALVEAVTGEAPARWVYPNADASGFFRLRFDDDALRTLPTVSVNGSPASVWPMMGDSAGSTATASVPGRTSFR